MNRLSRIFVGGLAATVLLLAASSGFAQRVGTPVPGAVGVVNTTAEIQARQAAMELANVGKPPVYLDKPYFSVDRTKLRKGPASLSAPEVKASPLRDGAGLKIQTVSTNFLGGNLADALAFPPDSMGTIGPNQFIVAINGRIRSFDKVTGAQDGVLDVTTNAFFLPGMTPLGGPITTNFSSDPRIRYDRGTRRWFLVIIDVPNGGTATNRIVIAVSDTPVISAATTWTYFFIPTVAPTDFIDYPTLGIDSNALYIGGNIFTTTGGFSNTDVWVVRKSSILGTGPIVSTAFPNLINDINCTLPTDGGAWTPQGVDNFDFSPAPNECYFVAVDGCQYSKLLVYRVSTPAGTPTLGAPTQLAVAATSYAADVPHLGNNGGSGSALGRLDGLDDRLYAAQIRGGRLWTAHSFLVENTGVAMDPSFPQTTTARNGVRWYEMQNLTTVPIVTQSGTIFDPTAGNAQTGNIKWYWIPSINVTGQGHAAVGFSSAGPFARANAAFTGRLSGDPAGTMDPVTNITNTVYAYNPAGDGGGSRGRRWGDYSYTSVDPLDNMTMWTIQDYAEAPNSWGVRVAKLLAPPPSVPTSVSVPSVAAGLTNVALTITGTAFGGSGYFDPSGSTTFTRIGVVIPGVTVQTVALVNPQTLNVVISTVGSTPGPKIIQVTNPDGQVVRSATALLTVTGTSAPLITSPNSMICAVGATCNFTFTTLAGPTAATFAVTGILPSGVTFATPSLSGTPAANTQGTYTLNVTASNGTLPDAVQTFKLIVTASCGGFSDVTGVDIYCNSVEWLRNRGVTLGCGANTYCPGDLVSRGSMALFMQRLGDTISPTWYSDGVMSTGLLTIDGGASTCATPDFPAVNYPRSAMVTWSFAGLAGAPLTARIWSRTSVDGGTTYANNEVNYMRVTSQGSGWASTSASVKVSIPAGSAPRFALRLDREVGTTTSGNFNDGRCNIAVSLASVNGGASPYDVPTVARETP